MKIDIAAGVLCLLACIVLGRYWVEEHDARLKAEAIVSEQTKAFEASTTQLKAMQDADRARDDQAAATIAELTRAAAAQKTPQQIAQWIPSQIPTPVPIKVEIPAATAQNPTPPAVFTVPQADLPALRDNLLSCQKNAVELSNSQADLSSCGAQIKIKDQEIAAVAKERDAYKEELKGGTFWRRAKKAAEYIAVGAAIGAAATCGSGHCK
ncbi:MAG TPA: hypothetical protein VH022_14360 [Candidatus Acidoferrum sp.]|jgi:hypothetical protein|nr:hypothetical protein [Candidatus Acidoferrum sp.]